LLEQEKEKMKMFRPIYKNLLEVPILLGVVIPILTIGSYALYEMITNFQWSHLLLTTVGYFVFMIMGITIGYHRYFCHKSFVLTNPWKERFILWAGVLAGQGSPIFWTVIHRGYHHRKPDSEDDPHSPIHGALNSFILWMFKLDGSKVNPRYAVDLMRNKEIVFIHENYVKIWLAFNITLLLISPTLFLYFSILPCFITLMSYNLTNCLNHVKTWSYKNFPTNDQSYNVPWLFPLVLGECWHNNHHGRPGASHFGTGASGKWWEFDPAGTIISVYRDAESAKNATR
jgi:stearoyl-CoA desaturase (delta-9 desaturase)